MTVLIDKINEIEELSGKIALTCLFITLALTIITA